MLRRRVLESKIRRIADLEDRNSLVPPGVRERRGSFDTAADTTTRCAFKIEDPSLGPGRVDFRTRMKGFA